MTSMKKILPLAIALTLSSSVVSAQPVIEATENLAFDAPEAWAMKYYASLALFTGMGVPEAIGAGRIVLGLEGGIIPQLSEDQRRVGFGGVKVEDLNRAHIFGRLRGRIGLSENVSLELGYVPPFEVDGIKPHTFSVAVGRPFAISETWKIGLRGYGHVGSIEGDITCSASDLEGPNPFDCLAPSNDDQSQRAFGAEVTTGYVSASPFRPYVGIGINYLDLEFQIDSMHSGVHDRTLQLTDGTTVSLTGGATYAAAERWRITGEIFYSWLSVVRPPETASENDGLFNFRFFVSYRIR
jgi:opacity protein-like surface antigen